MTHASISSIVKQGDGTTREHEW